MLYETGLNQSETPNQTSRVPKLIKLARSAGSNNTTKK
jgi:hypothetical protein